MKVAQYNRIWQFKLGSDEVYWKYFVSIILCGISRKNTSAYFRTSVPLTAITNVNTLEQCSCSTKTTRLEQGPEEHAS